MKYKKGDLVTYWSISDEGSSMRGIVVEVNEKYDLFYQDVVAEPLYRVLWVTRHQPEWHYEEDICSVDQVSET